MKPSLHSMKRLMAGFICGSLIFMALPGVAFAQEICTDSPQFDTDIPPGTPGVVTTIAENVQEVLFSISSTMFNTIVSDSYYQEALAGVLTLYISIYGMLFALGMVQSSVYDFLQRMIKIGIFYLLTSGAAWFYFNFFIIGFFNNLVNELINLVTAVAVGGVAPGSETGALTILDEALNKAISANMAVHLLSTLFTSSYGLPHAILLGIGLWSFLAALLTGIWVYLMSMVMRTLLFGIAPIFLACMLFDRTKHLFIGWLNQIINACLQPIFLFTFLSFFVLLVNGAIDKVLEVPVCFVEMTDGYRGTPFDFNFWRYAIPDGSGDFQPYGGQQGWTGPDLEDTPIFPIDILAVLIFFILAELGKRFNYIVLHIAKDLAGGASSLADMQGALSHFMSQQQKNPGGDMGYVPGRLNPDGTRTMPISKEAMNELSRHGVIGTIKRNIGSLVGRPIQPK